MVERFAIVMLKKMVALAEWFRLGGILFFLDILVKIAHNSIYRPFGYREE